MIIKMLLTLSSLMVTGFIMAYYDNKVGFKSKLPIHKLLLVSGLLFFVLSIVEIWL